MRPLLQLGLAACLVPLLCGSVSRANPPVAGPGVEQGQQPKADVPKDTAKKRSSKKAARKNTAIKALKTIIKNAEFKEMSLEDFAEWLGRTTETNVVVRWKVLEAAGVERDCPITLKRRNITVRDLLPLVFQQVTEDLRDVGLSAKADGNTIVISTHKDIQAKLILKTYDIQDLLITVPNFSGVGVDDLGIGGTCGRFRVRQREGGHGRGGAGQARTTPSTDTSRGDDGIPENARKLIDIITTQIQPLSWRANGGRGTIAFFKGRLVIRNSYEVHEMIGGDPGGAD